MAHTTKQTPARAYQVLYPEQYITHRDAILPPDEFGRPCRRELQIKIEHYLARHRARIAREDAHLRAETVRPPRRTKKSQKSS